MFLVSTKVVKLQQMFEIFSTSNRGQARCQILGIADEIQIRKGLNDLPVELLNRLAVTTWVVDCLDRHKKQTCNARHVLGFRLFQMVADVCSGCTGAQDATAAGHRPIAV